MENQFGAEAKEWAAEIFEKLKTKLKTECSRLGDAIPYISRDGRYNDAAAGDGVFWWTNGFWPGMLWQMYHAGGDEIFRKTAETAGKRLDRALEGFDGLLQCIWHGNI